MMLSRSASATAWVESADASLFITAGDGGNCDFYGYRLEVAGKILIRAERSAGATGGPPQ
jgi:hypothetical protein